VGSMGGEPQREFPMRGPTVLPAGLLAAALVAAPRTAAQIGQQAVCLQGTTGALNCLYDSFAQCQQHASARSLAGTCVSNPAQLSTTGRGGGEPPPASVPGPLVLPVPVTVPVPVPVHER